MAGTSKNKTHPHTMTIEEPIDAASEEEAIEKATSLPRVGDTFGPWKCEGMTARQTESGYVVTAILTMEFGQ